MLSGQRVRLAPLEKDDLPKAQLWVNDRELNQLMLRVLPVTRLDQERWLEEITRNPSKVVFAIKLLESEAHIGNTGFYSIDWIHRRAEFWILMGERDHWGKGIGSEVAGLMLQFGFESLNLNRICLNVSSDNQRAISIYEKRNFVREGLFREHCYIEGRYVDVIHMALLKRDYDSKMHSREASSPGGRN